MPSGTGTPGLTSEANSPRRRPPRTRTAAISVIAATPGDHPVVSRSITANSSSANSCSACVSSVCVSCGCAAGSSPAGFGSAGSAAVGFTRASFRGAAASRVGSRGAISPRASGAAPYPWPPMACAITFGLVTDTTVDPSTDISAAGALPDHSLLAVSGPVMRRSSGNVARMRPRASTIPAEVRM